jgi:hypothetical protein
MQTENEPEITFEGIKPDRDPDEGMIVMKGFLFLTDSSLTERKKALSVKRSKNLPNVIPIIKITPEKDENGGGLHCNGTNGDLSNGKMGNGLVEEQSVYSTVSSTMDLYGTRQSSKSRQSSIFTLTINQEQLLQLRRASKEFLEKITPIDMDGWKQQNWGGRGFEIIKVRPSLTLSIINCSIS